METLGIIARMIPVSILCILIISKPILERKLNNGNSSRIKKED